MHHDGVAAELDIGASGLAVGHADGHDLRIEPEVTGLERVRAGRDLREKEQPGAIRDRLAVARRESDGGALQRRAERAVAKDAGDRAIGERRQRSEEAQVIARDCKKYWQEVPG